MSARGGRYNELISCLNSKSKHQDEKEHVLVSLVLLFCPDMLDLVERPKVENMNVFSTIAQ